MKTSWDIKKRDIDSVRAEIVAFLAAVERIEKAQGERKRYEFGEETEAVRWRAVCLERALRPITEEKDES